MDFYSSFFVWLTFFYYYLVTLKKKTFKEKTKNNRILQICQFYHEMLLYLMKQPNIFAANKLLV